MPKSNNSAREQPSILSAEEAEIPSQPDETTSSEQESDAEVSFHTFRHQAQTQILPNMFKPCIEGPHMDWTVNDGLYHCFLSGGSKVKAFLNVILQHSHNVKNARKL